LLGTYENREVTIDLEALGVPSHELANLDAPFSEEEVWETIKRLPSDKASGPGGFTRRFYKTCWLIIKTDVMAAVSCVWAQKLRNLRPLNSAFITLLSKLQPAQGVKDYRPISLVHSFTKLVTKILAKRLAGRLQEIVLKPVHFHQEEVHSGQFYASATHNPVSPSAKAAPHSVQAGYLQGV
jgi:hypothetical protein